MPKIAFLFPGQGAQHVGMGVKLSANCPAARALFDKAAQILGYDLAKVCFEGPASELDTTEISQPAIFVTSLAALETLRESSPDVVAQCSMAAGLSLGEYTALVFAGVLSFEDGLRIVQRRGQAMQAAANATPSGMVSIIPIEREKVQALCDAASAVAPVQIANYLCPGNTVVSGSKAGCEEIVRLAEASGAKAIPLAVAGAFHTAIMQPACSQLAEALGKATYHAPRLPVISNVDVEVHADSTELQEILVRQVVSPVMWEDSVRKMIVAGVDQFYEIGPGKVLKGLLKRIDRKLECTTVNDS